MDLFLDFVSCSTDLSGFVPEPYCFDYRCFVVFSEVSSLITPGPFFFLKIALALQFLISVVVVQSLIHVWLFVTPWTAALQASVSLIVSQSWLKLMYIESVMPSNHLIHCQQLFLPSSVFPSFRLFSNESTLSIGGQSTGASASTEVLPMNIQGWFSLGLTGLISLLSKGLSGVFSNTTVPKRSLVLSLSYGPALISVHD